MNRRTLDRRTLLSTLTAGSTALLAGCLGGGEVIDETIDEGMIYDVDLEAGVLLTIELTNEAGDAAFVTLRDPDGTVVLSEGTRDAETYEYEAEKDGTHELQVNADGEAHVVASAE